MDQESRQRQFLAYYGGGQHSVRQFLRLVIRDRRLLEDACQAVALRLWEVFDTYDPSRPFDSWARGVAAKVALEMNRSERRAGVAVTPEFVEALAQGFDRSPLVSVPPSEQLMALENCLELLSQRGRELIVKRFHHGLPLDEVARQTGRSLEATYKSLQRTIRVLAECVHQRVTSASIEEVGSR